MARIRKDYIARLHICYAAFLLMGHKMDENEGKCIKVSNNAEKTGLCGAEVGLQFEKTCHNQAWVV